MYLTSALGGEGIDRWIFMNLRPVWSTQCIPASGGYAVRTSPEILIQGLHFREQASAALNTFNVVSSYRLLVATFFYIHWKMKSFGLRVFITVWKLAMGTQILPNLISALMLMLSLEHMGPLPPPGILFATPAKANPTQNEIITLMLPCPISCLPQTTTL